MKKKKVTYRMYMNIELQQELIQYFDDRPNYIRWFHGIKEGTNQQLNLRFIDYVLSRYIREHQPDLHDEYRRALNFYGKVNFDPFCRSRQRIDNEIVDAPVYIQRGNIRVKTTVGQLNLFRWFLENNLMDYIDNHFHDITREYNIWLNRQLQVVLHEKEMTQLVDLFQERSVEKD